MELNDRLILFRKNIRANQKKIIGSIISRDKLDICIFCGSPNNLTKEHVIPKWAFGNLPQKGFKTNVTGLSQSYRKTTVPVCLFCNSNVLGSLESELVGKINYKDLALDDFSDKDLFNIILWLEIIEFKFQVLDMRRKFLNSKNGMYIPYLINIPILIFQNDASLSPSKVFSKLRMALKRLTIKSKSHRYNSLVLYKSTNKEYHFFHKTNEFIFLELANYGLGLFYFFEKEFAYAKQAQKEAWDIIKEVY